MTDFLLKLAGRLRDSGLRIECNRRVSSQFAGRGLISCSAGLTISSATSLRSQCRRRMAVVRAFKRRRRILASSSCTSLGNNEDSLFAIFVTGLGSVFCSCIYVCGSRKLLTKKKKKKKKTTTKKVFCAPQLTTARKLVVDRLPSFNLLTPFEPRMRQTKNIVLLLLVVVVFCLFACLFLK